MKKLLVVLAIGAFAACNGSSSTENKVDSAVTSVNATADSAKTAIDSTASAAKDSLKATVDSVKK
jgi:uncharacterized protein (UPF0333 family)